MSERTPQDDPFAEEAGLHGVYFRRLRVAPEVADNAARDFIRGKAEDCDRCKALIEAFDTAMYGAFLNGTGPFR